MDYAGGGVMIMKMADLGHVWMCSGLIRWMPAKTLYAIVREHGLGLQVECWLRL